jgi:hypothetical protein
VSEAAQVEAEADVSEAADVETEAAEAEVEVPATVAPWCGHIH